MVYVRWDEEKQKKKVKIMLSTLGLPTGEKNTSERADYNPPQKSLGKESRVHRPQEERKKTNVIDMGNPDISDENVLKGKRKRGRQNDSPYDL
jgi:hypothetical protein